MQISGIRWIASAAALAALGACTVSYSGPTSTETRSMDGFDKVDVSAGANVVLKQGDFHVSIEGPEGRLDSLKVVKDGSTLKVYRDGFNSWFNFSAGRYVATITAPTFVGVRASSGGDVEGEGLALDGIDLSAGSGGDIEIAGTCKSVTADASSGGDIEAEALKCETGKASASSGGDIDLTVTGAASGEASSGGDITFHGAPASIEKDESSGGDVEVDS